MQRERVDHDESRRWSCGGARARAKEFQAMCPPPEWILPAVSRGCLQRPRDSSTKPTSWRERTRLPSYATIVNRVNYRGSFQAAHVLSSFQRSAMSAWVTPCKERTYPPAKLLNFPAP